MVQPMYRIQPSAEYSTQVMENKQNGYNTQQSSQYVPLNTKNKERTYYPISLASHSNLEDQVKKIIIDQPIQVLTTATTAAHSSGQITEAAHIPTIASIDQPKAAYISRQEITHDPAKDMAKTKTPHATKDDLRIELAQRISEERMDQEKRMKIDHERANLARLLREELSAQAATQSQQQQQILPYLTH